MKEVKSSEDLRKITSLVRLNILSFTPFCRICGVYDNHHHLSCKDCNKCLCVNKGSVFINSKTNKPYCFNCRLILAKGINNVSFQLVSLKNFV